MEWQVRTSDVLEVKLRTTCGDQLGINVLHYKMTSMAEPRSFQSAVIADTFYTHFADEYINCLTTVATFQKCQIRLISSTTDYPTQESTGPVFAGEEAGDTLPTQVCGLIRLNMNIGGRKGKGRVYMPFPPESFNSGIGQYSLLAQAAYGTAATAFQTALTVLDIDNEDTTFTLTTRKVAGGVAPLIQSAVSMQRWATQRRRGAYGKPNHL